MTPKGDPRGKAFHLVLSDEEHEMLLGVAKAEGVSAAAWLRAQIRRQAALMNARKSGKAEEAIAVAMGTFTEMIARASATTKGGKRKK